MARVSKPNTNTARPLEVLASFIPGATPSMVGALLFSIVAHGIVLSVPNVVPLFRAPKIERSLEVVLVNSKSADKPTQYKLLAQSNLDGGGNTDEEDRRAQTPLPPIDARAASLKVQQARYEERLAQLERQARRLMTQIQSDKQVTTDKSAAAASPDTRPRLVQDHVLSEQVPRTPAAPAPPQRVVAHQETAAQPDRAAQPADGVKPPPHPPNRTEPEPDPAQSPQRVERPPTTPQERQAQAPPAPEATPPPNASEVTARAMNIARLEAVIAKNFDAYQSRPKRKFIGARTAEYRFARYVEEWRAKVERIGNLNYPEAAKQKDLHGSLQLTVAIKADGQIESVEINKSSGHKILDAAAIHIVEMAAPFAVFSSDMHSDTDVLHITRTWTFTRADQLTSE